MVIRIFSLLSLTLFGSLGLVAQVEQPHSRDMNQTQMATRTVVVFRELERGLAEAAQHHDLATIEKLLSDDFELRTPSTASDPTTRREWIHNSLASYKVESYDLSDIAVHLIGEYAIASFILWQKAQFEQKDRNGAYFTVDVWQKNGNDWKLNIRYAAKADGRANVPQASPTGKD